MIIAKVSGVNFQFIYSIKNKTKIKEDDVIVEGKFNVKHLKKYQITKRKKNPLQNFF